MTEYHLQRMDREITDPAEILEVVRMQAFMTIAMARAGVPYLATVNYAFDADRRAFYFHCAPTGKKVDVIEANPTVWCQILEDRGYIDGKCDWAYRSVQFPGTARFTSDPDERRRALHVIIDKLERDPEAKRRLLAEANLDEVRVCRIDAGPFTGKKNLGPDAARRSARKPRARSTRLPRAQR